MQKAFKIVKKRDNSNQSNSIEISKEEWEKRIHQIDDLTRLAKNLLERSESLKASLRSLKSA